MFKQKGFTLIEVLLVMALTVALITGFTYTFAKRGKERAYYTRAVSEMSIIANAIKLKVQSENIYPADVNRALPSGIETYIATPNAQWPNAPWPSTVYDYENWDSGNVIQISARFCASGQNATCKSNAEKYLKHLVKTCSPDTQSCLSQNDLDNWNANSSVYFCVKENLASATERCRSHSSAALTDPGLRIDISSTH